MTRSSGIVIFLFCILIGSCASDYENPEINEARQLPENVCPDYHNIILYEKLGISIEISPPPPELGVDPFYRKYTDADGIPILSSCRVDDMAFCVAYDIVTHMLLKCPDLKNFLSEYGARVAIMAASEVTTDIPEHSHMNNVDHYRGLGGDLNLPLTTCGEENLLQLNEDTYWGENILIHEFAHAIHLIGLRGTDPEFDRRLETMFFNAKSIGLWANTYAGSNPLEYWAEGGQTWFNLNQVPQPRVHNEINTREELKHYDPALYSLLELYFLDDHWSPYQNSRWED